MSSEPRSEAPPLPKDHDDEIVALSKALRDQVRTMKARMRPEAIKGEAPSFVPETDEEKP